MTAELVVEDLLESLREFRGQLIAKAFSTERRSRAEVEEVLRKVYELSGRSKPVFFWLDDPVQLSYGPSFYRGVCEKQMTIANLEEVVGKRIRTKIEDQLGGNQFNTFFHHLWNILPERELSSLILFNNNEIIARRMADATVQSQTLLKWPIDDIGLLRVTSNMLDPLRRTIRNRASMQMVGRVSSMLSNVEWGARSLLRLATAEFARTFWKSEVDLGATSDLDLLWTLAQDAHAYLCYEEVCFLCERPDFIALDAAGRFHCETGPSIRYNDSYQIYAWHGTRVPPEAVTRPVTIETIEYEPNVAVRRVLIERYGMSDYVLDAGCEIIDRDDFGVLYRKELFVDEPIVMVRVTNSTPEPDGEYRSYFLRVPPDMTSVRAAVAWTFGLSAEEYKPDVES